MTMRPRENRETESATATGECDCSASQCFSSEGEVTGHLRPWPLFRPLRNVQTAEILLRDQIVALLRRKIFSTTFRRNMIESRVEVVSSPPRNACERFGHNL